jgi:hypothetical protein
MRRALRRLALATGTRSTWARALAISTLVVLSGSCSKPVLDTGGLQASLKQQLVAQLGARDITVTCPSGMKVQVGAEFQCQVTVRPSAKLAATLVINVKQIDDKGGVTYSIIGLTLPSTTPTSTPTT